MIESVEYVQLRTSLTRSRWLEAGVEAEGEAEAEAAAIELSTQISDLRVKFTYQPGQA